MSLIIASFQIIYYNNRKIENPFYEYKYIIEINAYNHDHYFLIVPILVNEVDGNISDAMNKLIIEGKATCNLIETEYGKALSINGNGDVKIKSKGNEKIAFAWLNLINNTDNNKISDEINYLIYCNLINGSGPINIYVLGWVYHSYNDFEGKAYCSSIIRTNLEIFGWQTINGSKVIEYD